MLNLFKDPGIILNTALLLIPFIIVIILILKFIRPKNPSLGTALAAGVSFFGLFAVKRQLKNIKKAKEKIAEFNANMDKFKKEMEQRNQEVTTNELKIQILKKERERLENLGSDYDGRIRKLDEEIRQRLKMNEALKKSTEKAMARIKEKDKKWEDLLKRFEMEPDPIEAASEIEIHGHSLLEG